MDPRFSDKSDIYYRDSYVDFKPQYIKRGKIEKANLLDLFEEQSTVEEPDLVQVYLRFKPSVTPNIMYEIRSNRCLVTSVDTATAGHGRRTQHNVKKMYTFSQIFGPDSSQKEIFEHVVKHNLQKLPEGHSYTLLTYGASGSGKTYTLMGTTGAPGLVPRSLEYVFRVVDAAQCPVFRPSEGGAEKLSTTEQGHELKWVKKLRQVSAPARDKYRRMSMKLSTDFSSSNMDLSKRIRYYVWVSFVEIYNEAVYDLLVSSDRRSAAKLCIREDANGQVYVKGVKQAFVRSGEEAFDIMVAGKHNLQVAATGVHAQSSRSHCIFTITMLAEAHDGVRTSSVRFCDLAGSERVNRTRNTGARMAESRAINSSLHVLERCLYMLRRKQRQKLPDASFVPYRESKLTRLLGAGLSGTRGEAVSMVVTLNPSPEYMHETRHVLQLAAVAKNLQVNNTIVESTLESSSNQDISYFDEIQKLRSDNERLCFELMQAQSQNKELLALMEDSRQQSAELMRELVEEAKDMSRIYYSQQLAAQEERHRAQMEELMEEYEEKLANTGRSSHSTGTPSRALQVKITQLMTELANLEEKLTAEKLARTREEEELQYLRACIDERDHEKCSDGNSPEPRDNEMVVLDSEEDETDDCSDDIDDIDNNDYLGCNSEEHPINIVNLDQNKTQINSNEMSTSYSNDDINIEYSLAKVTSSDKINRSLMINQNTTDSIINSTNNSTYHDESSIKNLITIDGVENSMDNTTYNETNESSVSKENTDNVEDAMIVTTHDNESSQSDKTSLVLTETVYTKHGDMNHSQCTKDQSNDMIHSVITENNNTDITDSSVISVNEHNIIANPVQCDSEYNASSSSKLGQYQLTAEQKNASQKTKGSNQRNYSDESNSLSNNQTCNSSLAQFEHFENAMINQDNRNEATDLIITHFDESGPNKVKKIYFDNLDNGIDNRKIKNRLTFIKSTSNIGCSANDGSSNSIEQSDKCKIKPKHMKPLTKHQSVDIFEECSPHLDLAKIKLESNCANKKYDLLREMKTILSRVVFEESETELKIPEHGRLTNLESEITNLSINMQSDKNLVEDCSIKNKNTEPNNTIDEFESIFKDITASKVSDFDELVSQDTIDIKNIAKTQIPDSKLKPKIDCDSVKYNLRHKPQTSTVTQDNTVGTSLSKIKYESEDKESIKMKAPKRNLRLRRRKNKDTDVEFDNTKLKDIANLQEEFSDITLDIPTPTPIKSAEPDDMPLMEEKENFVMETQSCPSKSVTRSRRKLFTPRAEPLDESVPSTGDSTERICVPRPSYRKGRARRKL